MLTGSDWHLNTPVAVILFKRPEVTQRLFEVVRQMQPPTLLIVADGPRADVEGEAEKCAQTRAIFDQIDWDCRVLRNYSDVNLGCKFRPASGISWVFEHVEEAIILEDDCIPDPSFFRYCEELLSRYRDDHRIVQISGCNLGIDPQSFGTDPQNSYFFSRYAVCWGWASWRRAWRNFDLDMKLWPQVLDYGILADILGDEHAVKNWTQIFQTAYDDDLDCWDFQWMLTCWLQNGLSILPSKNLVSNLGFGEDATHDMSGNPAFMKMQTYPLDFPLEHPEPIVRSAKIDAYLQEFVFDYYPKLTKKVRRKLEKIFNQTFNPISVH